MRVRLLKPAKFYWNYVVHEVQRGEEIAGELARHLHENSPEGTVEVIEHDPELELPPEGGADGEAPDRDSGETPPPAEVPVDATAAAAGTIDDLMAWVGADPERAAQALAAEQARDKPRAVAVKRLTAIAPSA